MSMPFGVCEASAGVLFLDMSGRDRRKVLLFLQANALVLEIVKELQVASEPEIGN